MTTVISPPVGTTGSVITTDDHGRNGNHGSGDRDWPERTAERVKDAVFATSHATELSVEKTGSAGILATNVASAQGQNLAIQQSNLAAVQATTFNNATLLAIQTAASASVLFAAQNQAAALAQAAECCCEIKTLVIQDGQKTRDLINTIQETNLLAKTVELQARLTRALALVPTGSVVG